METANYLGDHVSWTLLLLVPLYWIWADVKILLIAQAAVMASGVFPLYGLAREKLENRFWWLLFPFLYVIYPPLGFINRFDYHPETFVIPAFLAAFYYLERRRFFKVSLFLLLALFCKEQIVFTIFVFGLYIAIFRKERKFGFTWAVLALLYSISALFFIIPHFRGGPSDTLGRYGWLGANPGEIIYNIIRHPWDVFYGKLGRWKIYFSFIKQLPLAFLPLLGLEIMLIPFVEMVANYLTYPTIVATTVYYQYFSVILPFFFVAAIVGLKRLLASGIWLKITSRSDQNRSQIYLGSTLILLSLITISLENPFTKEVFPPFWQMSTYRPGPGLEEFHQASALIPPDAPLFTTMGFSPHFAQREDLAILGVHKDKVRQDYVLLNLKDWRWLLDKEHSTAQMKDTITNPEYGVLYYRNGVLVLKRGVPGKIDKKIPLEDLLKNSEITSPADY